jgi:hypothetical protein
MSIAQAKDDLVLQRITYRGPHDVPAPIPWPDGLAPSGAPYGRAAELTPGMSSTTWKPYAHQWSSYEPQLTDRSPARDAGCMGYVAQVTIGDVEVLAVKSELHLATDGISAPIVALWQQMVAEARPKLVISTGTAGGIGAATQLGDVSQLPTPSSTAPRSSRTSRGPSSSSPGRESKGALTRRASMPSWPRTPDGSAPWPPAPRSSPSVGQRAAWRPSTTSASPTPPTPSASSATTPRRARRRWTTPPCRWPSTVCRTRRRGARSATPAILRSPRTSATLKPRSARPPTSTKSTATGRPSGRPSPPGRSSPTSTERK